ncbi:MAG: transposase, partial [Hyphomicrobiales bacterium]|nr:transposase [Hyphomicrobiales bacterium]
MVRTVARPAKGRPNGLCARGGASRDPRRYLQDRKADCAQPAGAERAASGSLADIASAWQIVDWYRQRWMIEQLFRTMKLQGLQVEASQIDTAERLLKLI